MTAAREYHQAVLDCLNLAEAARDTVTQDALIQMAERWAQLADRSEEESCHPVHSSETAKK
jgi:hypothetical protein